jgi:hypothetical protein
MANVPDEKVDRILEHMDALHTKIDESAESHKQLAGRLDAIEKEREQEKADKARKDAEAEPADRARRDGEDETEYADRVRRMDAERAEGERLDTSGRLADPDRQRRNTLQSIEKDAAKFADVQMRCDAAYQAWNKQAPHALYGEQLRDFRIRLLTPLKTHSKVYADSALSLVGDDAAFRVIEDAIINDAVEASSTTFTVGAPLREVVTRTDAGHVHRKFIGDASVTWSPFMGGATKFGRIVRPTSV